MSRSVLTYVVNSLNPGGTEKLVADMSLAFASDFNISVICLDEPGLWAENLRAKNIPVYCLWRQAGLDMNVAFRLSNLFRRHRTNIIHAHQCTAWFYSALSRLLYAAPILLMEEHGRFYPEVENRKRVLFNRFITRRLTHRFVAVSEDVRERLQKFEGLDRAHIEVVYNGVNPGRTISQTERTRLRSDLGFNGEDFVVGTVGRFDPIKNLPMMVRALDQSLKDKPSIRGLLVGGGPAFTEIKALIEKIGLSGFVTLTGHRDDARNLMHCIDLFVLSSFSEGTSMALLEAMAAGVPVAVTGVGGNTEIVIRDRTGWVIPSGSVEGLSQAILEAAKSPEKRRKFAEAGKRRFEERFTFDRMIRCYREIYQEMIERHGFVN